MGMVCSVRGNYFPFVSEPVCILGENWLETAQIEIPQARQTLESSSGSNIPIFDSTKSVDLDNPAVLSEYLDNKKYLPIASKIATIAANQFRQTAQRSKYGQVFPIRPELLAYEMRLARNETVLEIAGADGKAGILMALAGAKKAYVNDILPEEMALFRQTRKTLPQEVSSKLTAIEGDCFDLLKIQPELKKSCGLVLCNNFIHFLNDQKMAAFTDLLKSVLKIGGVAIITVNGKSGTENAIPHQTAFEQVHCLSDNYRDPYNPAMDEVEVLETTERPISGEKVSSGYTKAIIYRKDSSSRKWTRDTSEFNKLTLEDQEFATELLKKQTVNDKVKNIRDGAIRILKTTTRKFDENDLKEYFTTRGFKVESTFADGKYERVVAIIRSLK
jgi:SAM-dependent methyltransferase